MTLNQHNRYFLTFENEEGKIDCLFLGRNQYHILATLRKHEDRMSVKALYNYITPNWLRKPPISSFYAAIYSLERKGFVKKVERKGTRTGRRLSKYMYQIDKLPKNLFVQINKW